MINTITELYRIFDLLNKNIFDGKLEHPIILIQSSKKRVLGTCSVSKIWQHKEKENKTKYEITISAENLNRPTNDIVETLLHEMVHLYCSLNDISDTSNNFVYHNKKYKEEGEKHGLIVEYAKTIGWAVTKLKSEIIDLIKRFNINETAFDYYRNTFEFAGVTKQVRIKYGCPGCNLKISHHKKVDLICGLCNKTLEERI